LSEEAADESAKASILAGIGFVAVSVMALAPDAHREENDADDRDDAKDEEKRIGHLESMMHLADRTIVRGCAI
jgi:hypothetical protein